MTQQVKVSSATHALLKNLKEELNLKSIDAVIQWLRNPQSESDKEAASSSSEANGGGAAQNNRKKKRETRSSLSRNSPFAMKCSNNTLDSIKGPSSS